MSGRSRVATEVGTTDGTTRESGQPPRTFGRASSPIHHGEILQGVFTGDDGRLHRGLLTMPCDLYSTQAMYVPMTMDSVAVVPGGRVKAVRAAIEALAALGHPATGGYLRLMGDVPPSRGFGSSTSDVLASIWAVTDAFDHQLPDNTVARIAVRAEAASDSIMFRERSVLFAQREGAVIEDFRHGLPLLSIVGFGTSRNGAGVDTLSLPAARYLPWEIAEFDVLRGMVRAALCHADPALLGVVATRSAAINQRHLPIGPWDLLQRLARDVGALGLQVAHSGDIAGLLFDGRDPDTDVRQARAVSLLADADICNTWQFTVGTEISPVAETTMHHAR